jgi:hypothetical protein
MGVWGWLANRIPWSRVWARAGQKMPVEVRRKSKAPRVGRVEEFGNNTVRLVVHNTGADGEFRAECRIIARSGMEAYRTAPFPAAWLPDDLPTTRIPHDSFAEIHLTDCPPSVFLPDETRVENFDLFAGGREEPAHKIFWIMPGGTPPSVTLYVEIKSQPKLLEPWKATYRITPRIFGEGAVLYTMEIERVDRDI